MPGRNAASGSGRISDHNFAQIPGAQIQRSQFNRSHGHKTTFDAGFLVPILVDEALPGDTFNVRLSSLVRMTTPIYPTMDNLYMDVFFFAVPNRLVWDNWQKFMGEQENPGDSIDFMVPVIDDDTATEGTLADYMGIPINIANLEYSALKSRAYNLIWNEWFRDQNLQNSVVVNRDDGPDSAADYQLLRRGKRHDYFTSALPFAQKGTAVTVPLGESAPVWGSGDEMALTLGTTPAHNRVMNYTSSSGNLSAPSGFGDGNAKFTTKADGTGTNAGLVADLSAATAATINQLRESFQIQRLLERDARGGSRYTEIIRSHFGVTSPDQRLQRPEYLGGGSARIVVAPVAQTNEFGVTFVGDLGAYAVSAQDGIGFVKSFVEHSIVIGLVNVRADLTYQQGLERMWSRRTRYEYFWPALAHLGEQAVLNKEIYAQNDANDDLVFGYQERYAEYRYKPSRVSGIFRSDAAGTLDSWHLALDFDALPLLNDTFIEDQPPMDRILSVTTEPEFRGDFYFSFKAARPMPTYSVPGLIDHF